jgi:hypothetical protein
MKTAAHAAALVALSAALVGCEEPQVTVAPSTPAPAVETKEDEQVMLGGGPRTELPEDEIPITDVPRKFTSHDPIKGRRSRTRGGALGATMAALPYAEHQTIINNIDYALKLYEAEHGEYPKSQEEFDAKIIKPNNIVLPAIPDYAEYIYVPEQATVGLQIRRKQSESNVAEPAADPAADPAAAADPATAAAPADAAAATESEEGEPTYDIRSRAAEVGNAAANRSAEELQNLEDK